MADRPAGVRCCSVCGDAQESLVKRNGNWICDPCDRFEDNIDCEAWEANRRARLAEAQES